MAICVECGIPFSNKRAEAGYNTCLECGGRDAAKLKEERKQQVAPAYNKGAYQYITSRKTAKDIGR